MKKIRKISSMLVMAMLLFVSSGVIAFAAPEGTLATSSSTANINVTTGNPGDTLDAFKVVNVTLDDNTNNLSYDFTNKFQTFLDSQSSSITVEDYVGYKDAIPDSEGYDGTTELKTLLAQFKAYVLQNSIDGDATQTAVGPDGRATFANVSMGHYIIIGTGSAAGAVVYSPVTANVVPTAEPTDGKYYLKDTFTVDMKNEDAPTADKEVEGDTANIGGELTYTLKATVPTYPTDATNKTFFMRDTLSNGLTLNSTADQIVVKADGVDLTQGSDYTITIDGQVLYIDFVYESIRGNSEVTAEYVAVINDNAIIAGDGNENTFDLVYSNSPYEGNTYDPNDPDRPEPKDPGYGTQTDTEKVYTYQLIINKYSDGDDTDKLVGATFEIYDNMDVTGQPIGTITTGSNGFASFAGLAAGDYWLKETVAPAGYNLLEAPVKVAISNDNSGTAVTTTTVKEYTTIQDDAMVKTQAINENGEKLYLAAGTTGTPTTTAAGNVPAYLLNMTTTVNEEVVDGTPGSINGVKLDVPNKSGFTLPSTGGMGTQIFTIVGITLMLGTAVVLVTKKRMSNDA